MLSVSQLFLLLPLLAFVRAGGEPVCGPDSAARFAAMDGVEWTERMRDDGAALWEEKWFLDGEKATVVNTARGIEFRAGKVPGSDADHAVLWTRGVFDGDIRIEYDFTRLDSLDRFVNIIYIQADGSGEPGFGKDIYLWRDRRAVPAMRLYFDNMNTLHISYAAYGNDPDGPNPHYIRGRRYMPERRAGLEGTELTPEYLYPVIFVPLWTYRLVLVKRGVEVAMKVSDGQKDHYYFFDASAFPPVERGRVGLRQMSGRSALYANITISTFGG